MDELAFPFLTIALASPLVGAWIVGRGTPFDAHRKTWALCASALSAAAALGALFETASSRYVPLTEPILGQWLFVDALSAAPLALFALVSLGVVAALSKRDAQPRTLRAVLLVQASTLAAYAAANPAVLTVAWLLSTYVLVMQSRGGQTGNRRNMGEYAALGSFLAVAAALVSVGWSSFGIDGMMTSWQELATAGGGSVAAFGFLMLAVVLRKGLFPAHSWVIATHRSTDLPTTVLLLNGHLAAFLIARVMIPLFPTISGSWLLAIGDLALFTALYAAVLAIAERSPRRILAMLLISQSSFVLAGIATATPEGVSGALIYWMVVTVATTSLAVILRAVEQRVSHFSDELGFLGLAQQFPRLATYFVVCGVALVGMPGTMGFISDELLLHGALEAHPRLGLVMPIAAALNAFHLYRLFSRLFLGSPGTTLAGVPDARLGERLPLTAALFVLILGGLIPSQLVGLRAAATDAIVGHLNDPAAERPSQVVLVNESGSHSETN